MLPRSRGDDWSCMNSLPLAPICFGTGVTCVGSLIRDECASFADGVCASEDVLLFSLRRLGRLDERPIGTRSLTADCQPRESDTAPLPCRFSRSLSHRRLWGRVAIGNLAMLRLFTDCVCSKLLTRRIVGAAKFEQSFCKIRTTVPSASINGGRQPDECTAERGAKTPPPSWRNFITRGRACLESDY